MWLSLVERSVLLRLPKLNSEMWLSLVERCVRDAEAAGSNPVISTSRSGSNTT